MWRFLTGAAAFFVLLECVLLWRARYREWRTWRWWRGRLVSTAPAALHEPAAPWNPVPSGRISGWWPGILAVLGACGILTALSAHQVGPALEGSVFIVLAALIEWARRRAGKSAPAACAKL